MILTPTPVPTICPIITKETVETAAKHLGFLMLIFGAIGSVIAFIKRIIKKIQERKSNLTRICEALVTLEDSQKTIQKHMTQMDEARNVAREEDRTIRTSLYMGQIAVISALRELAEHQGLKINGPVQLYYEQNIEALRTGLGLQPLKIPEEE